jgi:hypothetical protein
MIAVTASKLLSGKKQAFALGIDPGLDAWGWGSVHRRPV